MIAAMLLLLARDSITATSTLEFPAEMRPAFDIYQTCLNEATIKRTEAKAVDFKRLAAQVIADCKTARVQAFAAAQTALDPDPKPSPDRHAAFIEATFKGVEASLGDFVETLRTSRKWQEK